MNYPRLSEPPKLRGVALSRHMLYQQREWIQACESNGVSYAGENGPKIRQADEDRLRSLEAAVAAGEGPYAFIPRGSAATF